MNTIVEKVQETLKEGQKESPSPSNNDFNTFVKELQLLGLDSKPTYTLPQIDTIGKSYQSLNQQLSTL